VTPANLTAGYRFKPILRSLPMTKTSYQMARTPSPTCSTRKEIMWDAAQAGAGFLTIPKGSPRTEDAYKFLAFAGSPQAQADLTRYIPYGPLNKDAMALVDAEVLPNLPNTSERRAVALYADFSFILEKNDELSQRFNAWLAK